MKYRVLFLMSVACFSCLTVQAQNAEAPKPAAPKSIDELRLRLNEDGSHYIKATFLNQVWFRGNESNPQSAVLGQGQSQTFDIGLRRTRIQLYGQLTDHVLFYFQFGQNNFNFQTQNANNRKIEAFFHDALGEYRIKKGSDLLYLGGGLTITNGLSRFSQPSIGGIMTMDVPVFAQATVDQTDEFSRKLSMYARGQLGRLDYRLVMSDPFPLQTNGTTAGTPAAPILIAPSKFATFAQVGHHKQYQGFFMWNFFEKESHVTPYMTGTYLGKKKVLNLEAGFITQGQATWTTTDGINNKYHDMNLWSVGVFYDTPLDREKGTALNAYAGYFHTDYGPGYLRYNGIMNPSTSATTGSFAPPAGTQAGSYGNAYPMFGTGSVFYAQAGYLLKKDLFGEDNGTLMPYASVQSANYSARLNSQMTVFDIGLNWFIKGHTSKFTLDYQNRPVYSPVASSPPLVAAGDKLNGSGRKSSLTLQYQILF